MKRISILPILMLALFACNVVLTACDDEEEQARLSKEEKERLRIEDSLALKIGVLPTSDCEALLLGDTLHIFDTLGVDVHLRHYNALSECRLALRKGYVEGAVVDSSLIAIIQQSDTTPLYMGPKTEMSWKLIASRKARVNRIDQLVDKIVAADSHGKSHDLAVQTTDSLRRKNKSVYIVQCEDVNVRSKMLMSGNVDAAMLPEPFAEAAIKDGGKVLKDYTRKTYGVIAFRSKAMADKRIKKQYQLFLKGLAIANDSLRARKSRRR